MTAARIQQQPIAPFPVQASSEVRSFRFTMPIIEESEMAKVVRNGIDAQFGALAAIDSLSALVIAVEIEACSSQTVLERPATVIEANIRALATMAKDIDLTVDISVKHGTLACEASLEDMLQEIVPIMQGIQGVRIRELVLRDVHDGLPAAVSADAPAYAALQAVARSVEILCICDAGWATHLQPAMHFEALKSLSVAIGTNEDTNESDHASSYSNVLQFVNASAEELRHLTLNVGPIIDVEIRTAPLSLQCPKLKKLELLGNSLAFVQPCIVTLPCETLVLRLGFGNDWSLLLELINRPKWPFPRLKTLLIRWAPPELNFEMDDSQIYRSVRDAFSAKGISISVEIIFKDDTGFYAREAIDWLSAMSEELTSLSSRFCDSPEDQHIEAGAMITRVNLPRLADLDIRVSASLAPRHDSAVYTFGAVLRRIRAPQVSHLRINLDTPYSDYLPILQKAIEAGAFPSLRRISGLYKSEDDRVTTHRKNCFLAACSAAGIATDEVDW